MPNPPRQKKDSRAALCGCLIIQREVEPFRGDLLIEYCPLHKSAQELLDAVTDYRLVAKRSGNDLTVLALDNLIAKASIEGKGELK